MFLQVWLFGNVEAAELMLLGSLTMPRVLFRDQASERQRQLPLHIMTFLMIVMRTLLLRGPEVLIMEIFRR